MNEVEKEILEHAAKIYEIVKREKLADGYLTMAIFTDKGYITFGSKQRMEVDFTMFNEEWKDV